MMKKTLVALSIAGISSVALAQSNVTVYGVADVSYQGQNVGKSISNQANPSEGGQTKVGNNSSLIGFKGVEDLGNGNKALFQMETGFNINGSSTSGTSGTGNYAKGATTSYGGTNAWGQLRDSYVGYSSKYGTGLGGFLTTPYRATLTSLDVMPGATSDGRLENVMGKQYYGTTQVDASIRATAIAYAMPTLYGVNGSIAYTGNGGNNLTTNAIGSNSTYLNSAMSANLGWAGYGFGLTGGFLQGKITSQDGSVPLSATTNYLVGATYTGVPGLKVATGYYRNTLGVNASGTTGAQKGSNNGVSVGASYRFGNNEPRLQYAHVSNTDGIVGNTNNGATQWSAQWGYYLSKRTQVYGLVSNISNNNNAQYNFLNATGATGASVQGTNLLTYGAGLRTNF